LSFGFRRLGASLKGLMRIRRLWVRVITDIPEGS
jgi:hypothetical protein